MVTKKLSEIADIKAGGTPSRAKLDYWDGDIPWIKISNINSRYVTEYDETISQQGLDNSSAKMFDKGTILYTIFATLGRVGILTFNASTNQAIAGIKLTDNSVTNDYLYYYLRSLEKYVKSIGNGVAQQNINLGILKNFEIPIPSKEEQGSIVKTLDTVEKTIEVKANELSLLDELVKSRFVEMFETIDLSKEKAGWVELEKLTKIYTGTTPSSTDESNWNGDILWITPAEMSSDSFYIYDTVRKITEKGRRSKSLDVMPVNTVLLSTRAPIGKVGIVGKPMACNQGFKNFECGPKLNPVFLYTLLKNNTAYLNSLGSGTTFLELSKSRVAKLKVPVPNIELQNQFADFVFQVDKSKFVSHSRYFLWEILTLFSSTIAYSRVVSILAWPNIF